MLGFHGSESGSIPTPADDTAGAGSAFGVGAGSSVGGPSAAQAPMETVNRSVTVPRSSVFMAVRCLLLAIGKNLTKELIGKREGEVGETLRTITMVRTFPSLSPVRCDHGEFPQAEQD